MAQSSKKQRRERRVRRKITQTKLYPVLSENFSLRQRVTMLEQFANEANKAAAVARVLLMSVIGQQGGSVEVTKGTIAQCQQNAERMGWTVTPKPGDETTVIVTITEEVAAEPEPALTISKVEDEPEAPTVEFWRNQGPQTVEQANKASAGITEAFNAATTIEEASNAS